MRRWFILLPDGMLAEVVGRLEPMTLPVDQVGECPGWPKWCEFWTFQPACGEKLGAMGNGGPCGLLGSRSMLWTLD